VSEAIRTPQGFAFIAVTGKQDSYIPKLDEVKAKVRDEVLKKKAGEVAKQKAVTIGAQMKSGDFNAGAKAAGLDVKTTEFIARGAPIGDVGVSPAVDTVAFAMQPNAVSDPIATDNGTVIVKVLERQDPPAGDVASGRAALKTELVNERRTRFYASYMTKARERMKVKVNRELIAQLVA
jgi:peptidyl-prolyl cis-trans isomerase D